MRGEALDVIVSVMLVCVAPWCARPLPHSDSGAPKQAGLSQIGERQKRGLE